VRPERLRKGIPLRVCPTQRGWCCACRDTSPAQRPGTCPSTRALAPSGPRLEQPQADVIVAPELLAEPAKAKQAEEARARASAQATETLLHAPGPTGFIRSDRQHPWPRAPSRA